MFVGSYCFVVFVVFTLDVLSKSGPAGFVPGATERMALTSRARDVVLNAWRVSKQVKHGGSGFQARWYHRNWRRN